MKTKTPILDANNLPISGAIDEILIKYCAALREIERLNNPVFIESIKRIREREEEQKLNAYSIEDMKYHSGVIHGLNIALEQITAARKLNP